MNELYYALSLTQAKIPVTQNESKLEDDTAGRAGNNSDGDVDGQEQETGDD